MTSIRLIMKHEHDFYQQMMAGIVHLNQPTYSIPDFIDNFWTGKVDQRHHRIWLLDMIGDGIQSVKDTNIISKYFALESIISAMLGADRGYYLR